MITFYISKANKRTNVVMSMKKPKKLENFMSLDERRKCPTDTQERYLNRQTREFMFL